MSRGAAADPDPQRGACRVAIYGAVVLAGLALTPWLVRSSWTGDRQLHTLFETVAVVLAAGVAAIALLRFYSRRSDIFLLLGAAFAGTACLDAYHAVVTSELLHERLAASGRLSTGAWSWLAGRLFLALFFWRNAPVRGSLVATARLSARRVLFLVAGVTLACCVFFTLVPLPSAYFPDLPLHRPAELLPALFFLLALVRHLRFGSWRAWRFEHWLLLSLLLGLIAQTAFVPFALHPFDAPSQAAHLAKIASYACVLNGLLQSMYSLFRKADAGAAELVRVNAALQAEIDERARAEAERDRFFDMSIEMLAIAGMDGYFKQLNASWEKALGWTRDELKARPYAELVHPDDRPATAGEVQRLRLGMVAMDYENRYLAKDGSYRWLSWRSSVSPDGSLIYAVARDIQDQKRVEQMKNDFVSVVSHELRTPLTSIRGSLGLIAGGVAGELPEKARTLVEIAAKNSERLVRLINDILDVEKIESGKMGFRFAPVELMPLVETAVEGNRAFVQGYEVELRITHAVEGVRVWADPDRLLQVMANLLANAAKFSPRGGVVEVAVTRGAGEVRVTVTDHGRGVPPEFRPRVFEKFAQAESSSTREQGGTGLGLSISRAIVERHRGRIAFASEPKVATAFFFDLPEWGGEALEATGGIDRRARILVCEDDPDVARLLGLMLEREGYRADLVHDAAAARRCLREGAYAAMTLDLMLPDQNGLALIRELRRDEPTRRLPIVVVSVHAEAGRSQLNGGVLGVVDWLVKPIDEGRLRTAMQRAIHSPGAPRAAGTRILHVEDDGDLQRVVAAIVGEDAEVEFALDLAAARERLVGERFDLVILDLALPDGSGLELLPLLGSLGPSTPVLIFSAHEVDAAVADRVASVLVKSQTSNDELLERIRAALGSAWPAPLA